MSSLGFLSGGTWSAAQAITTDGSKVFGVGNSTANTNGELFMWTSGGGMVGLIGVQSNQFPRALDLGRQFRAHGLPVVMGGFHVSGCIAMLPEISTTNT